MENWQILYWAMYILRFIIDHTISIFHVTLQCWHFTNLSIILGECVNCWSDNAGTTLTMHATYIEHIDGILRVDPTLLLQIINQTVNLTKCVNLSSFRTLSCNIWNSKPLSTSWNQLQISMVWNVLCSCLLECTYMEFKEFVFGSIVAANIYV